MTIQTPQQNPFQMETGDFFRLYTEADTMTRNNLVLGMHMKLHEYEEKLKRMRAIGVISAVLFGVCILIAEIR